jgi:hypothetical protein
MAGDWRYFVLDIDENFYKGVVIIWMVLIDRKIDYFFSETIFIII